MSKCDFNKVAKQLYWNNTSAGCSPVNLLHISRTPFSKNTPGWLLLSLIDNVMRTMVCINWFKNYQASTSRIVLKQVVRYTVAYHDMWPCIWNARSPVLNARIFDRQFLRTKWNTRPSIFTMLVFLFYKKPSILGYIKL